MNRLNRPTLIAIAVAVLLIGGAAAFAATRDDGREGPVALPQAPTPTGAPTTTEPAIGPVAPLTGLPLADEGRRTRTALTVKIDNHPEARPQFGIDRADVIVEEKVEGGLSRFMAIFHSEDANRVGPVRSLRTTDANWLKPLGGLLAYSGGIDPVKRQLTGNGVIDIGADNHGTRYYKRRGDRPFEHSMYVDTNVLRELTPNGAAPAKALFAYGRPGQPFSAGGATPVNSVTLRMESGGTAVGFDWTWDAAAGVFRRGTDGRVHEIEGAGQIGMKNVVVQFTSYAATPYRDRANSVVDEALVVGSGDAWVLSGGQLVRARWSRPDSNSVTKYTDASGAEIKLQPGRTWLSLVPPGQPNEVR